MADQHNKPPTTESTINCAVCLKEIPASEAKNAEASDYVRHFCGLDCYQQWDEKMKSKTEKNTR